MLVFPHSIDCRIDSQRCQSLSKSRDLSKGRPVKCHMDVECGHTRTRPLLVYYQWLRCAMLVNEEIFMRLPLCLLILLDTFNLSSFLDKMLIFAARYDLDGTPAVSVDKARLQPYTTRLGSISRMCYLRRKRKIRTPSKHGDSFRQSSVLMCCALFLDTGKSFDGTRKRRPLVERREKRKSKRTFACSNEP